MAASTAGRHETRALLRAHLAAAMGYRHLTRTCPICHRLLRLAMERPDCESSGEGSGTSVPATTADPASGTGSRPTEGPAPAAGASSVEHEGPRDG